MNDQFRLTCVSERNSNCKDCRQKKAHGRWGDDVVDAENGITWLEFYIFYMLHTEDGANKGKQKRKLDSKNH